MDPLCVVFGSVTDPEVVDKTVRDHDVVAHLAAWASVDASIVDPMASLRVNVEGTALVLDAARRHGVRVLLASSCEVYGELRAGYGVQIEEASYRPHSPYAVGKLAADRLATAYARTYDLPVIILRPSNVFGPRQRAGSFGAVIPMMLKAAWEQHQVQVTGNGSQVREFTYVADVVAAYDAALQAFGRVENGSVFNVGSGELVSMSALASTIASTFDASIIHVPPRAGEVHGFKLDSSRAMIQLQWHAQRMFWTEFPKLVLEALRGTAHRRREGDRDLPIFP